MWCLGARFRNEIVDGVGGRQILVEDPAGNPVELFQPTRSEARLGYGYATIRNSRVELFSRRPPASVTVTMSSMRTPKRPGR